MSLLHEIQASLLQEGADLAPILLKLRLLAARIGSVPLAEWVRHESEGYPDDTEIPNYRHIDVSYTASFAGSFGRTITNAPISPFMVSSYAGEDWVRTNMRVSIAAVDDLLTSAENGKEIGINAANLIHLFQGNIYPDYNCLSVTGRISKSALASIRHSVRSRILELTLELEKSIPGVSEITLGPSAIPSLISTVAANQIAQQIIYGNYTSIAVNGDGATIRVGVLANDTKSLEKFLIESGMASEDAIELANLAETEMPDNIAEPMGPRVSSWFVENIKKAASGTWKMGVAVATEVIKEALLKFYGFK